MPASRWFEYGLAILLALALVGLLAYARGEPGDDGRVPSHDGAIPPAVLIIERG